MRPTQTLAQKSLLLAFDAFGTLFKPRAPIAEQYGEVARRYGIGGFTQQTLNGSFRVALKHEAKENPNYGRTTGLGAEQWWRNVMSRTFSPFLESGQEIPQDVYADLLTRFSTHKGYKIYPDILPFFEMLRRVKGHPKHRDTWKWDQTVVSIITNSDDRVISVLESLGLNIAHRKIEKEVEPRVDPTTKHDVNFVVLSYDVGFEKPHPQMFEAAKYLLKEMLAKVSEKESQRSIDDFEMLYVGDDLHKDYFGAKSAGWNALYLDREGQFTKNLPDNASIATVSFRQEGSNEGKVELIRDLCALCNWVPK